MGLLCLVVARTLKVDYSWYDVLVIFIFYLLRNMPVIKFTSVETVRFLVKFKLQIFAFLGFIPIILYNGKPGRKIGNIYYSFYALHLLLFGIIKYHYLFRF
ncbi:TraX family protein [Elizabethkingia meningoseptica]|uniref:TraX family protein n=1 Tax=Elizabethkingia meningoseptica TaxID=238 RepID=UPI0038928139